MDLIEFNEFPQLHVDIDAQAMAAYQNRLSFLLCSVHLFGKDLKSFIPSKLSTLFQQPSLQHFFLENCYKYQLLFFFYVPASSKQGIANRMVQRVFSRSILVHENTSNTIVGSAYKYTDQHQTYRCTYMLIYNRKCLSPKLDWILNKINITLA